MRESIYGASNAQQWLDQRTEDDTGGYYGEVDWRDLYDDACRWHEERGLPKPPREVVGHVLASRYMKRSTSVRRTFWVGVKLKDDGPSVPSEDQTNRPYVPHASAPDSATGSRGGCKCRD